MATAAIGHNVPPARDLHALHIEELMEAARQFLDGDPIISQQQADDVGRLLGELRQAKTGAEDQRKIEAKPFDDGKAEVQAFWSPLKSRIEIAEGIAKKALAPWLEAREAEARAVAEAARLEAEKKAAAARAALTESNNLAAREEAERLLKDAGKAERAASKAEKAKPMAAGLGRSVSLRSRWVAVLTDSALALKHYREHQPEALREFLREQAQRDVNAGTRSIPGFTVNEERTAQ